ncbi:MAG: hypothetical protein Q8P57_03245 [Candidatus Pacearchaeota archaeon]|nr:hypothetical protein [Candidatus Pacearchaeota archaeon]
MAFNNQSQIRNPRKNQKIKSPPLNKKFKTMIYLALLVFFIMFKPFENPLYNNATIVVLATFVFIYLIIPIISR